MNHQPPKYAYRFLKWYCTTDLIEEIEGDLYEAFQEDILKWNLTRAKFNYWLNVLLFFKPFSMKKEHETQNNFNMSMLYNYFIVSVRNLRRKAGYSLINIGGLAAGIACCIIILLFVNYQKSYDNFQLDSDDTYRVALERIYPDRQVNYAVTPPSFGPLYVDEFPEVLAMTRISPPFGSVIMEYDNEFFDEKNVMSADSTLFELFTFDFLQGDQKTALKGTKSMILSESKAKKYFGDEDPMGKVISNNFFGDFQVTGVFKDYPENSHVNFEIVIPILGVPFQQQESYTTFSVITYVKLQKGFDPKVFEEKLPAMVTKYAEGDIQRNIGISYAEYVEAGNGYNYFLQPMRDIYLNSNLQSEFKQNGSYSQVLVFIFVAVFILIIAGINFMNLSTARSTERAKEVGIRKVLGSVRNQLMGQFLTESILVAFLGLILALLIVFFTLPYFGYAANVPLEMGMILNFKFVLMILGATLLIGIMAGLYPALVLSSFRPVVVLKGKLRNSGGGLNLRNGLVVFQFGISIILIASTLIIHSQMNFLLTKDMGFDSEKLLIVENAGVVGPQTSVFRQELVKNEDIINAGYVSSIPGTLYPGFIAKKTASDKESYVARLMNADAYGMQTMNLKIKEGRLFDESFNDSLSVIINESAVEKFGYIDPVGKKLYGQVAGNNGYIEHTIVGVIKDYHFHTLHREIEPQVIKFHAPTNANSFVQFMPIKIKGDNIQNLVAEVESKWQEFVPNTPFKYYFMDEYLGRHYENEKRSGSIFFIFTTLAIIIACVGLFSLAAYISSLRKKEIGIRKVLGGTVWSIVLMLSKDFTKLIGIAIVFALPISYYWMNKWLDDFAYRINVDVLTLVLAGLLALAIGWLTISFQSIKAAVVNPSESLKDE
ncbi:MAG: ABC transporter permease [Reichenbachiella sp.]